VWVPENRVTLRSLRVLADQATETIAPHLRVSIITSELVRRRVRRRPILGGLINEYSQAA
jgi:hypothetical protein